jgi:hypothetical protein
MLRHGTTFPRRSGTRILHGFCSALAVQKKLLGLRCLCIQFTFEASGTDLWCLSIAVKLTFW